MHNPAGMVPAHASRFPLCMVAAPVLTVLCYLQPHQVAQPLYDKSQVEGSGHVEEVRGLPMTFSTLTMSTLPSPHGQSNHLRLCSSSLFHDHIWKVMASLLPN